MKKTLLLLLPSLFCIVHAFCQPYPDLSTYTVVSAGSTAFNYHCTDLENLTEGCNNEAKKMKMENPPWIIGGGGEWRGYFTSDGVEGTLNSVPYSMIGNSALDVKGTGQGPFVTSSSVQNGISGCPAAGQDWRRSYYAIISAQYFTDPTAGTVSLGFLHAENKYNCGNGCPGTINPQLITYPANDCTHDYYPTYAAFVCGSWIPNVAGNNWGQGYFSNDMGPITWPSGGYLLPSGQKCSLGVSEPTSIQYNGYMYVFYVDMSHYVVPGENDFPLDPGRHAGVKVARAPLSDALNPLAYKVFYQDAAGNQFWNPSLPAGFTKENLMNFVRGPGPQATDIMGEDNEAGRLEVHFSVAQVRNTNYFIGIESYTYNGIAKKGLRYSSDLVHWTPVQRDIETATGYYTSALNYANLLSADGWSNNVVDQKDFYVIGTTPNPDGSFNNLVNKVHVYLPAPPPPPPPPPPVCYDSRGRQIRCPAAVGQGVHADQADAAVLDDGDGSAAAVYPNPGPGIFQLHYTLTDHAATQLNVLDLTGRPLQKGNRMLRPPGRYTETINISAHARGIYLLELMVNGGRKTFKVVYE